MEIDKIPFTLTYLQPCWACKEGTIDPVVTEDDKKTCSICHGYKLMLTDAGRELLAAMKSLALCDWRKFDV